MRRHSVVEHSGVVTSPQQAARGFRDRPQLGGSPGRIGGPGSASSPSTASTRFAYTPHSIWTWVAGASLADGVEDDLAS